MLIIDTHCHTGANWKEPIETLSYHMERNGVSHAVLVQFKGQYNNSYLFECMQRYKGRFKAVIMLNPRDKVSAKTLEKLQTEGVAGIRLDLRINWDPEDTVFSIAGELGMIMSVIGKAEQFASTRFKKLLDACPKTQFCLEHLARSTKPGIDFAKSPHDGYKVALECARWPNTTIKVPGLGEIVECPSELPAGFPFSTVPPLFEMVKEAFGVQRMMWASNFPPCANLEGYRNALEWVKAYPAFQSGDDIEWIMGKSAAKLWGFPS